MSFEQFIEQNKSTLLALHMLSQRFSGRFGLETPYPPAVLSELELEELKETLDCAEALSDFFIEKVDQYDMDYDQCDDPGAFEALVYDDALKFVTLWRQCVFSHYALADAPPERAANGEG